MEHKIETDVRNAYDNMPLEELSEYMENVDIPTVSDESKARIKKLVNEKIGINNSNGDFYRGKNTKNERNKVKKSVSLIEMLIISNTNVHFNFLLH